MSWKKSNFIKPILHRERFVSSFDQTVIFYELFCNKEEPVLVTLDGILCDGFIWKYFFPYFSQNYRIVHPHYRGHGRSSTPLDIRNSSIFYIVKDLSIVFEDAKIKKATLLGHSMGVQVALEFYHLFPKKVDALVLICGSYGKVLDTFHNVKLIKYLLPIVKKLYNINPSLFSKIWKSFPPKLALEIAIRTGEVNPLFLYKYDLMPYLRHLSLIDFGLFIYMLESASKHNTWEWLDKVEVPVLIIAGEKDSFTPSHLAIKMAERIPKAQLLLVKEGTHIVPIELADLTNLRIEKFLREVYNMTI